MKTPSWRLALTRRVFNRWKKKRGQVLEELVCNDVAHFESWERDICHLVRVVAACPHLRLKPPTWARGGFQDMTFPTKNLKPPKWGVSPEQGCALCIEHGTHCLIALS